MYMCKEVNSEPTKKPFQQNTHIHFERCHLIEEAHEREEAQPKEDLNFNISLAIVVLVILAVYQRNFCFYAAT